MFFLLNISPNMADRQSQQDHPSLTKAERLALWDTIARLNLVAPGGHTRWAELLSKANDIGYATKAIEEACDDAREFALAWYPDSLGHDIYYAAMYDHFDNALSKSWIHLGVCAYWHYIVKATDGRKVDLVPLPRHLGVYLKHLAPDMILPAASVPSAPPSAKPPTVENDPYKIPYKQAYWHDVLDATAKAGHSGKPLNFSETFRGGLDLNRLPYPHWFRSPD